MIGRTAPRPAERARAWNCLTAIFFTPFVEMWEGPVFFTEVVLNGILTGVMYSLVALGFVLIFKASEIFNFAQGVMVLFAALSLVGLMELGVPAWLAVILTLGIMVVLALVVERVMLRPLVNQDPFILFMADHRAHVLPRGVRRDAVGQQRQAARHRDPR